MMNLWNNKKINFNTQIIIFLFSIMPLADTFNGILKQNSVDFSLGILYRLFSMLGILYAIKGRLFQKKTFTFMFLLLIMFSVSMFHILAGISLQSEIYMLLTWLTFPIFMFLMINAKKSRIIDDNSIITIVNNYLWIVPLTILIPRIFRVGITTYQGGQGYKAFYHATNGISYFLGVLVIITMLRLVVSFSIKSLVQMLLVVACCMLVGTVSSLGSIVIAILVAIIVVFFRHPKYIKFVISFLFITFFALLYLSNHFREELTQVYLRRMYFYNAGIFDSFLDFITSGRTVLLKDSIDRVIDNNSIVRLFLIGQGFIGRECEMDFFDFFLLYGSIGVIGWVPFIINIKKILGKHALVIRFITLYSLIYAGFVGHVFTNAMSSMLFSLLLCTGKKFEKVIVDC